MEKNIKIGDKEFVVKELKYLQVLEIEEIKEKSSKEAIKTMISFSTGMNDTDIENLTVRQGLELQKVINELNGFQDFRIPTEENK